MLEPGYLPDDHLSVSDDYAITDIFKDQDNDEMKRLSKKNNCELVIVPHNLTIKF